MFVFFLVAEAAVEAGADVAEGVFFFSVVTASTTGCDLVFCFEGVLTVGANSTSFKTAAGFVFCFEGVLAVGATVTSSTTVADLVSCFWGVFLEEGVVVVVGVVETLGLTSATTLVFFL